MSKEKLVLHSKAWQLNTSNIDKPWFAPNDEVWYCETAGKAKSEILKDYTDLKDKNGDDLTFTTIKVERCKGADKYLVNGKVKTMKDIEYDNRKLERDNRLNEMLISNPDGMAYIRKGGYYYRPNSCGYTEQRDRAGIYTLKEAVSEVKGCSLSDNMDAIPIDQIDHNKMINEQIHELQNRLIK